MTIKLVRFLLGMCGCWESATLVAVKKYISHRLVSYILFEFIFYRTLMEVMKIGRFDMVI